MPLRHVEIASTMPHPSPSVIASPSPSVILTPICRGKNLLFILLRAWAHKGKLREVILFTIL